MVVHIADCEEETRLRLTHSLCMEDFSASGFGTLPELAEAIETTIPNMLVLDLPFPNGDGLSYLRFVLSKYPCSVIMTNSHRSESDMILGFELGCDDYLTKPFSPKELMLRVEAVFRRTSKDTGTSGSCCQSLR